MEAIVLVGGFGTRLLPLTKAVPKPLIPLVNVPFLDRTLDWLAGHGIDHVVMSLHYNADHFMEHFREHAGGVEISFAVEDTPLGTGGAIRHGAQYLRGGRGFIFNGDIFTDLDLRAMRASHEAAGAAVTIAMKEVDDPSRYGVIETDRTGRIHTFTEKPTREAARSRDINAGIYLFEREALACFPDGPCSVERQVFPVMLEQGVHLHGFSDTCYWTDLGTPRDYLQAHRDILSGQVALPLPPREKAPGIHIAEGAEVAPDACLRPPVVLGPRARVEAGAVVGPLVVLGVGCTVGAGAQVEDSVLWAQARVEAGSRVRGSILGRAAQAAGQVVDKVCADDECVTG